MKVSGKFNSLIECINPIMQKYIVRWDIVNIDENSDSWEEQLFLYKPDIIEIKNIIITYINKNVDKKILSGFVWNEIPVWLSTENQFNFKAAYDLVNGGITSLLPLTFKLGENTEGVALYHTFNTAEDLYNFYISSVIHVQTCLYEGWMAKDNINLDNYLTLL